MIGLVPWTNVQTRYGKEPEKGASDKVRNKYKTQTTNGRCLGKLGETKEMNYIYRMTHIRNVPHILEHGITHKSSPDANPDYVAIGDSTIINKRQDVTRTTTDGMDFIASDYIPFYFYARMPMLYNIQHGYGVKKVNPEDIVYLIVDSKSITEDATREYLFSDGHAVSKMTKFYNKQKIDDIDKILDIAAIKNNKWSDDYEVRERKQAEFLVKGDIGVDAIFAICCYNEKAKAKLLQMGAKMKIIVSASAYY